MPLFLNDDQTMLQDTARGFLKETAPVAHLRALRDAGDPIGFSRDVWAGFAEMGFTGVMVPESHGGLGLGAVEAGVILEEIGRNLTPSPFLSTSVGAVSALVLAGQSTQERWLPGIAQGAITAAVAVDEAGRHRPQAIAMSATRRGNGWSLSGEKRFVIAGHAADVLIVAARTAGAAGDTHGLTLFAVEGGKAGLTSTTDRLVDSSVSARMTFDGVEVDADAVIGEVDGGWNALTTVLSRLRAGSAAELVGVSAGAMDRTIDYLRERKQFGRTIGEFQALQHRAAHLYSEIEVAQAAVLKAQQLLDAGSPDAEAAALVAKAQAALASTLAVQEGVQMHGGIGMTDEHDIGLYMKRQRVLGELYGDADALADRLAVLAGY